MQYFTRGFFFTDSDEFLFQQATETVQHGISQACTVQSLWVFRSLFFVFREFHPAESNIRHFAYVHDVFVIYNKAVCRLRSISSAAYKVIVPSGAHLAEGVWNRLPFAAQCVAASWATHV